MSRATTQTDGEQRVKQLLRESFEPHTSSRQAVYHAKNGRVPFSEIDRHDDGEQIFRGFERGLEDGRSKTLEPFWKLLESQQRALDRDEPAQVLEFPQTFLNALVHLNDAEKQALEQNDLAMFEDAPRTRRKVLEFLAQHPEYLSVIEDGGKEIHSHAKPGRGKSSFMNMVLGVRNAEINHETVLYALTLDELEILPLAPWTTILKPAGTEVRVTAKPTDYRLPEVEIGLDDVFRDVIEYTDPIDVFEQVVPGGIYGVLPDPEFRQCEEIVNATYLSAWEAEEPTEVTPLRDFTHALLEVRAKHDVYLHPTTLVVDEFGDVVPQNPEDNHHDEHTKVKEWPRRFGKGRKKNLSLGVASHTLDETDSGVLSKERWFATFPRTPVPSSSRSGLGNVPVPRDKPRHMDLGECVVWDSVNYVEISWPNPYRRYDWHGEIVIDYPGMEAAL